jgi:hypothetical protein
MEVGCQNNSRGSGRGIHGSRTAPAAFMGSIGRVMRDNNGSHADGSLALSYIRQPSAMVRYR